MLILTINGSAQTIKWLNAVTPTITASRTEMEVLTFFNNAGTYTVTFIATGYPNNSVVQTIGVGVPATLVVTVQPTAPLSNGGLLVTQPVVQIKDQYGNATTSTCLVTATSTAPGTWTIGGTTAVSGVAGTVTYTNLTATSAAAVPGATIRFTLSAGCGGGTIVSSSFNIPNPPVTYYNINSGTVARNNLQTTVNWTTDAAGAAAGVVGSGAQPLDFTSNNQRFQIVNGGATTISGPWTVSGTGSYVVVGDGTAAMNLIQAGI